MGFVSVYNQPHHIIKRLKRISRIVVLPDYQGIGIAKKLINYVAELYIADKWRVTLVTSHPAMNKSLKPPWILRRQGRNKGHKGTAGINNKGSEQRNTCSWEYIKNREESENGKS